MNRIVRAYILTVSHMLFHQVRTKNCRKIQQYSAKAIQAGMP